MTPERRERQRERRRNFTPEQRARQRELQALRWRNMTQEQRERRRELRRALYRTETPEQRERRRRASAEWQRGYVRNRTPERRRQQGLQRYGLSLDTFEAMLEIQRHRCAICGRVFDETRELTPHVDHDHATGRPRGLLCRPCNTAIGYLRDSPERARAAVLYLDNWRWAHRPKETA